MILDSTVGLIASADDKCNRGRQGVAQADRPVHKPQFCRHTAGLTMQVELRPASRVRGEFQSRASLPLQYQSQVLSRLLL